MELRVHRAFQARSQAAHIVLQPDRQAASDGAGWFGFPPNQVYLPKVGKHTHCKGYFPCKLFDGKQLQPSWQAADCETCMFTSGL